jgi:hypothetical protein
MILGDFTWRKMTIQADMIANDMIGEAIWLNRVDTGSATPYGIIRNNQLFATKFTPTDDTAVIELRSAFEAFRATTREAA